MKTILFAVATAFCLVHAGPSAARDVPAPMHDLATPMLLVATPALEATEFGQTVVLALADGGGGHIGLILNLPMQTSLAQLLPNDEDARRVDAPLHFGGPQMSDTLFALVRGPSQPAPADLLAVTPQISLALNANAVKQVMVKRVGDARFFVGLVAWRAGQLAEELRARAWDVTAPEVDLVLNEDPAGLWKQLAAPMPTRLADSSCRGQHGVGPGWLSTRRRSRPLKD